MSLNFALFFLSNLLRHKVPERKMGRNHFQENSRESSLLHYHRQGLTSYLVKTSVQNRLSHGLTNNNPGIN